jgi:4-amino-4-deoxy-L-arabinose transferase-like glycosyltransferase
MKFIREHYVYIAILAVLIYFAVFLHLDSLPFRMWDESYLATHTYEMARNHDYIVTRSFGAPEMSNTKPPLVIWCMVASTKIIGFNELGIRLPNALAAVMLCFLLFVFLTHITGEPLAGFSAVIMLISSAGYICLHVVRSAEYDSILTLLITLYCLCFFMLTEINTAKQQRRLWLFFTLGVIFAILTKGIAAMMIMPALFIYALIRGKILWFVRSKETYISAFFIVLIGLGYYYLREHFNPGYIQAVAENELGGRYVQANEGHTEGPWFYIDFLLEVV